MCIHRKNKSLKAENSMKKLISALLLVSVIASLESCSMLGVRKTGDGAGRTDDPAKTSTVHTTDAPQTTEPPVTEPLYDPAKVSFIGCGDNIIYYGNVREAAGKSDSGRAYGFKYSYEHVADIISSADVAFINQETLMCGDGYELSYYPNFNSPQDLGYDLIDLGFDVVNIANNHMLDQTGSGLEHTIEFWQGMPVLMIGGYTSEEDYNTPRYLESNGLKIAFLSYTYGTNGYTLSNNYNAWVPYLSEDDIRRQTAAARENSDVLIVSVHWGIEGAFAPSDEQKNYARIMAECGVDVIVGHHPHVIQPVEWISRPDGGRTLCVYSLGNFMAEQAFDYNMVGGIISFDLMRDERGNVSIESPLFIPTVFHFNSSFYNNQIWPMESYTADMAASHGISAYGRHTSLDTLKKYVTDTVAPEFLPGFLK